jgi:hypothetical protein
VKVSPALAFWTAMAGATACRPQEIRRFGQGGSRLSRTGLMAPSGSGISRGASQRQGLVTWMRFTTGSNPSASARPRHWTSIPALPSVTTQQVCLGVPFEKSFMMRNIALAEGARKARARPLGPGSRPRAWRTRHRRVI